MDIVNAIDNISLGFVWSKAFTFNRLLDFSNNEINSKVLRGTLLKNPNFVFIKSGETDQNRYILKSSLFKWFFLLNLDFAREGVFKASKSKISLLMSLGLRTQGKWSEPPKKIVDWAMNLGLIQNGFDENQFVFPLAGILTFFTPNTLVTIRNHILDNFVQEELWNASLGEKASNYLDNLFENLPSVLGDRTISIVKHRTGLLTGSGETLEQIGGIYGITRERVRQIEKKFWYYSHHPSRKEIFLKALICYIMSSKSSLIIDADPHRLAIINFLAKWANIPVLTLPYTGLKVIGFLLEDFSLLGPPSWKDYDTSFDKAERELNKDQRLFLSGSDIDLICQRISAYRGQKRVAYPSGSRRRIYLALRDLGKPSHYSDIARVHNELFPQVAKTDRIIHAALGRYPDDFIWIGVKGTFALKEWGYKKPSKGLFDSAAEIVKNIYFNSKKPVPLSVIAAEMGKYRQVVNHNSFLFAIHMNPKIQQVSSDLFIPNTKDVQDIDKGNDNLDKALREFHTGI